MLLALTASAVTNVVLAFASGPRRYAFVITAGLVLCISGTRLTAAIAVR